MLRSLSLLAIAVSTTAACELLTGGDEGMQARFGPGFGEIYGAPDPGAHPLRFTAVVPAEVEAGATVPVMLSITNTSDEAVVLELGGVPGPTPNYYRGVIVTGLGRRTVANTIPGHAPNSDAIILPALRFPLEPGETARLDTEWDQRDLTDRLVAPGSYQVHGGLGVVQIGETRVMEGLIVTEATTVTIR